MIRGWLLVTNELPITNHEKAGAKTPCPGCLDRVTPLLIKPEKVLHGKTMGIGKNIDCG